MFRRAKNFLADVLQQADMILLALCCAATLFGITMVYSATRYMQTNRLVIIQGCALVLGVVLYLLVSMVDLSEVVKKWKWLTMFNFGFILLLLTPFGRSDGTGNRAWLKFPGFPVICEGHVHVPADAKAAIDAGAWAVVAGTGITHPTSITSWFVAAIEG